MEYLTIEEAAKFHGHLGPFLLLGYMAGTLARETLKPKDEHDLHAEVTLPLKTPYTCVVDGIQCSTRCTLGKLNIKIKPSNKEIITIMIKCKSSGKVLEISVKSDILSKLTSFENLDEAVKWLQKLQLKEIFQYEFK